MRQNFSLTGPFLHQRITLLHRIATALHCTALHCTDAYWLYPNTSATVAIYGAPHHLDRIEVLYNPLLTRMLHQATASPCPPTTPNPQQHHLSWMHGFTISIKAQLRHAETTAATTAASTPADLHSQQHTLDAKHAAAEKNRQHPNTRRNPDQPELELGSVIEGIHAGKSSDGQNER